jgi:hypothetical protein
MIEYHKTFSMEEIQFAIHEMTTDIPSGPDRFYRCFLYRQDTRWSRSRILVLSVFSTLARYIVVKIARSCFEVVLRTTKQTMVYPSLGPSLDVIALRLAV